MIIKFKIFESIIKIFNPGDIVLFKDKYATKTKTNSNGVIGWDWKYPKKIGVIIEWCAGNWIISDGNDKNSEYHVPNSRVLRLATDKDRKKLDFENQINKYNL